MDSTSPDMWGSAAAGGGARGAWLRDSRFGMFIHWGLYSHLGGRYQGQAYYGISEWIMHRARIQIADYERLAAEFNPVDFDAAAWVALARDAGMRHLMITAKHHDGFAMFGSRVSRYNIVDATPFGRDPLQELATACAAAGLRLGFYYSQTADWHELDAVGNSWDQPPAERDFDRYLQRKALPQIDELLTSYGPVAGIWFDTPGPITPEQSRRLVDRVHELQPQCLVNSRIGNGLGDYDTLGDQEIPRLPRPGLWETPDTHNDTWAYAVHDTNWKSPGELARRLVRVASRGGTYLLNVGPDGRGRIPAASARILRTVGEWVQQHRDAIHGADPTPLPALPYGEATCRGDRVYLYLTAWPRGGEPTLLLPATEVRSASLAGEPLPVTVSPAGSLLQLPLQRPAGLLPVVELQVTTLPPPSAQYLVAGFANTLEAALATTAGCTLDAARWMEKFGDWHHAEVLGDWQPASRATWQLTATADASWYLDLEYSTLPEADYQEWWVEVNGERLGFPLVDTGERPQRQAGGGNLARFRDYRLGWFDLPAGPLRVVLGPLASGTGVRVAGLHLRPVD
ncbi:MAG: alpha-L-fucosidase [Fimbriimonadaceae bacterium]|nr:alpha-L-fucosidase [Fimbriimonadaceae bacterium]